MGRFRSRFLLWPGLFVLVFVVVLCVYHRALKSPLIYDDVAVLLYFNPARAVTWAGCFKPWDNGFLRPVITLIFKLIHSFLGTNPVPYHLAAFLLHSLTATGCGGLVWICLGDDSGVPIRRRWGATLGAALATAVSAAVFPSVFVLTNGCDVSMALGLVVAATAWVAWLRKGGSGWLIATILALVFSLGGKEIGLGFGAAALMFCYVECTPRRGKWVAAMGLAAVCLGYGLLAWWLQLHTPHSYSNNGKIDLHPFRVARRGASYLVAAVFPGTYLVGPVAGEPGFWQGVLHAGQVVCGVMGLASLYAVWKRNRFARAGILFLEAVVMIVPAAILNEESTARFVYASAVLVTASAACAAGQLERNRRATGRVIVLCAAVWMGWQVVLIRKSGTTRGYYEVSREWGRFEKELARLSPQWPPMQLVTVYTGPEYGSHFISKAYGGAIFRVYFPNLLADYYVNEIPPGGTRQFRFDGKHLIDITRKQGAPSNADSRRLPG